MTIKTHNLSPLFEDILEEYAHQDGDTFIYENQEEAKLDFKALLIGVSALMAFESELAYKNRSIRLDGSIIAELID